MFDNPQTIFLLEVFAVLAVPGPTNSLLFVSGVTRGLRNTLALILAELGAYLISIAFLVCVAVPAARLHSTVGQLLRIVCSLYLAQMALWLWRWEDHGVVASHPITFHRVFTTTLVNPKTLVFAFVIFPTVGLVEIVPYFISFSAVCIGAACGWIAGGALLHSRGSHHTRLNWLYRGEACLLAGFAIVLLISAFYDA
ncbi:MAG TPA: LysE family transporter [Nitrospira sp.]|nr:LysE family transporter [Nitrospira sp.]